MRYPTKRSLGLPFLLLFIFGSVHAQTEPRDDPSRFLANPEVRQAVEQQTPLTSVALQPYGQFYLVDVKIDNRGPFKFRIDSGAPTTIVDTSVVQELGLSVEDQAEGRSPRVEIGALALGSARFVGVAAEVRDLEEIWGEGSPSGVFGFELFGERLVTLDLPLQKLVLHPGELPPPDGQEILAYTVQSRDDDLGQRQVPTIEIAVAGRTLNVELNPLGFGTLTLPKNQMERFPLASESGVIGQAKKRDEMFPIFGASLEGSMVLGSHRFDQPSVFFSESFEYPSLGSGTLEHFVLTLDPAHRRVRLERPTGRANPLLSKAAGLVPQSGEGDDIRSAFNKNVDRVRLMVLLSPT